MVNYISVIKSIDTIISVDGGLPQGRMVEVYGPNGGGKTTFAILAWRSAINLGLKTTYIDVEGSLVEDRVNDMGVDYSTQHSQGNIVYPDTGEEALDLLLEKCKEGYGFVVLDSVAGLVPQAVEDRESVGDSGQFAQVASLLAKALPKIRKYARLGNTCIVFINQIRANFNKFGMGPDTESAGGFAIKHTVDARFEIRRISWIKYSDKVIGFRAKIVAPNKNRFAPPHKDGFFNVSFDSEFKLVGDMENLVEIGEATKKAGFYEYKGQRFRANNIPEDIFSV